MLSYSAFAVACSLSLLYLVVGRSLRSKRLALDGPVSRLPSLSYLERAAAPPSASASLAHGRAHAGALLGVPRLEERPPRVAPRREDPRRGRDVRVLPGVLVRAHRGASPVTTARLSVAGFVLVLLSYTAVNLFFSTVHSSPEPPETSSSAGTTGRTSTSRARLAFTPERALQALEGLFRERILTEGAVVSTCNRSEIYGLTGARQLPALSGFLSRFHSVDDAALRATMLRARRGDGAAPLPRRVGARLDGPRRGADPRADARGPPPRRRGGDGRAVTGRLFQAALECGKRVRTETSLGARPTSVPGIALGLVGRVFESLEGCGPSPRRRGDDRAHRAPPRGRRGPPRSFSPTGRPRRPRRSPPRRTARRSLSSSATRPCGRRRYRPLSATGVHGAGPLGRRC